MKSARGTEVPFSDVVVNYHGHIWKSSPQSISVSPWLGVYDVLSYFAGHTAEIRTEIQDREHALRAAQGD